jgi:hypothetical protein
MCPQFRGVAVASHVHNVVALREILETLNPALKLGRGNGGFREGRNLVLESQKPTNELQAAKEGLSGDPHELSYLIDNDFFLSKNAFTACNPLRSPRNEQWLRRMLFTRLP